MGLHLGVYRTSEYGDCTNGGLSSKVKTITVVNVDGPFDPSPDSPAFKLVKGAYGTIKLVPVNDPREGKTVGPMMGGNYAATSDSRFSEACRKLLGHEFYGAVPIHDRYETQAHYDALTR